MHLVPLSNVDFHCIISSVRAAFFHKTQPRMICTAKRADYFEAVSDERRPMRSPSGPRRVGWCAALIGALTLPTGMLDGLAAGKSGSPATTSWPLATPIVEDEMMFSDVVRFVQRNGWPQDLGPYCETLGLARSNPDCRFKQLGAEDNAKPEQGHAINLPANTGDAVPYVLMLLRGPGTVEFFIASPQGDLIAAFHGTVDIGYVRISNDSALPGFTAEVSFWKGAVGKSRRAPESR